MDLNSSSDKKLKALAVLAPVLAICLIGFIDYKTGYEFGLSLFYLIPISVSVWFNGKSAGMLSSALSAVIWFVADRAAGNHYSHAAVPYWNTFIRLGFFLVVTLLLNKLRISLENEKKTARIDGLTGAMTSRFFLEIVEMELARSQRFKTALTIAYIDLDHFKEVNDSLGHYAGNETLKNIASTMLANLRKTDFLARLGGDEFAILFPGLDSDGARVVVPKIRSNLLKEMKKSSLPVTFSIGVLTIKDALCTVEECIKLADNLMYSIKRSGKNAVNYDTI
jgi:diguanylate cyclase (GGDEF)-like protein